jgi:hypothetical protein
MRRFCQRERKRGAYVHPSHLYDEDEYNQLYEERGEPSGYGGW